MASVSLTSGAIAMIAQGLGDKLQPILQVLEIRLVNTQQSSAERYRMLLSDGVHHQQGMLATQMNGIVKSGLLQKGCIVRLNEFICNTIQNRRIIIVICMQVLVEKADVIGEPKIYDIVHSVPQNLHRQQWRLNQPVFPVDNVKYHGGSPARSNDTGQHSIEDSSFSIQGPGMNSRSSASLFSDAEQRITSLNLTSHAIARILEGVGERLQPLLQVLEIWLVNDPHKERYRILLSDGVHYQPGMLATQMNEIVKSSHLQKGSIVQLNELICNSIMNRRIIIIISLQVMVEKADMIGKPEPYGALNQPGLCNEDYVEDQMKFLSL